MAEVLSPCGSFETLMAVLKTGTDAVYVGSRKFSARAGAHNFDRDELKAAVYECHKRGVKLYQAINTVITDDELDDLVQELRFACEIGVDGIILQDLAVLAAIRQCCPELPAHASTQMTIHTKEGALLMRDMGFSRVVLARELPIGVIKEISAQDIETEVFVHGALCMSVSGQCYISALIGGRSANRGMCAQACRLPVSAIKGKERYDLSLKDMTYIPKLTELSKAGVASLKIEGRMKRPEYSAAAADACNKALAGEGYDISVLADVFSRGGFTDGYYYNKTGSEMFGTRTKENVKATNSALPKIHELYRYEHKYAPVSFSVYAHTGERLVIEAYDGCGNRVSAEGDVLEKARNRPADKDYFERHLSKLGDTIFELSAVNADIGGEPAAASSQINKLRREVCERLEHKRADKFTQKYNFSPFDYTINKREPQGRRRLRLFITNTGQLARTDISDTELVCFKPELAPDVLGMGVPADKCSVIADRFTFDEAALISRLKAVRELGINDLTAENLAHIRIGKALGMRVHGDFGLSITNSAAAGMLAGLGVSDITLSFELKASALAKIGSPVPVGVFAYGRLPLMLNVNCPVRQALGCKDCTKSLYDRTGRTFKLKCSKKQGYVEILNSDVLVMPDKTADIAFADFLNIVLYDETPEQVREIINAYKSGVGLQIKDITRGLYYRGLK